MEIKIELDKVKEWQVAEQLAALLSAKGEIQDLLLRKFGVGARIVVEADPKSSDEQAMLARVEKAAESKDVKAALERHQRWEAAKAQSLPRG